MLESLVEAKLWVLIDAFNSGSWHVNSIVQGGVFTIDWVEIFFELYFNYEETICLR
jgi:hypothetical protein